MQINFHSLLPIFLAMTVYGLNISQKILKLFTKSFQKQTVSNFGLFHSTFFKLNTKKTIQYILKIFHKQCISQLLHKKNQYNHYYYY